MNNDFSSPAPNKLLATGSLWFAPRMDIAHHCGAVKGRSVWTDQSAAEKREYRTWGKGTGHERRKAEHR